MSDWQRTLDLHDVWPTRDARTIAKAIGERLRDDVLPFLSSPSVDEIRENLSKKFLALAKRKTCTIVAFEDLMSSLYDWGDISLDGNFNGKKVCWIRTAF